MTILWGWCFEGLKPDILFFIDNTSGSPNIKFLDFGQYFAHTLPAYFGNGRLKNLRYKKVKQRLKLQGTVSFQKHLVEIFVENFVVNLMDRVPSFQ